MGFQRSQLRQLLTETVDTARAAGRLLLHGTRRRNRIRLKGKINLVTEMDLCSEKLIVKRLRPLLPAASFLTEEAGAETNSSDYKWIIDPLDGTTNYAHGFPVWCVSIALEYQGQVVLGVVYDPTRDELFTASTIHKARLNGVPIRVSERRKLGASLLATGFPYDVRTSGEDNLNYFAAFVKTARAVRRAGSAALDLCYLAAGRFDGFWELKLHPWDTAAAVLIVKQAGGKVSDFEGLPFSIYNDRLLATNGRIHAQMRSVLRRAAR